MKYLTFLSLLLFIGIGETNLIAQSDAKLLYDEYEVFKERTINERRFDQKQLAPLLQRLRAPFEVSQIGTSVEGRPISMVKIGTGKIKVLLWSQMHGNEPTATMALMDLFNFFSDKRDFMLLKEDLLKELTLYFIPMLNPDGAARFERRNAMGVDINRDALRLESPEGALLEQMRAEIKPDWGFNLHDQSKYYSAGIESGYPASFSFLAPAFNYEKEVDSRRRDAMLLIAAMNKILQQFIPGQVGKYSDSFEPRAFGDNIQKAGTRTILVEIGGMYKDPEKQELRRLHFVVFLKALEMIANKDYERESVDDYKAIPNNSYNRFKDLILRKLEVPLNGKTYVLDIAINRKEVIAVPPYDFYEEAYIDDLGDLSTSFGYEDYNFEGFRLIPGKVFPSVFETANELKNLNLWQMIKDGYTDFQLNYPMDSKAIRSLPIRLNRAGANIENSPKYGGNPSFYLEREGELVYLVTNGQLWDLSRDAERIRDLLNRNL